MPRELDVVALREAVGRWPVGTEGTIVHLLGAETGLVEIDDDEGRTLDTIAVAYTALNVIWHAKRGTQEHVL